MTKGIKVTEQTAGEQLLAKLEALTVGGWLCYAKHEHAPMWFPIWPPSSALSMNSQMNVPTNLFIRKEDALSAARAFNQNAMEIRLIWIALGGNDK